MTHYHKKNPFNNRVLVDYEKRSVRFEPVGAGTIYKYWFLWFNTLLTIPLVCALTFLAIIVPSILFTLPVEAIVGMLRVTYIMFIVCYAFLFCVSLIYFIPSWRHKHFPSTNARLVRFNRLLLSFKKLSTKRVLPHAVVNNTVFIPNFNNVELHYFAIDDFKKQLKCIRIDTVFEDDPWEWYFVFEFKRRPKNGYLDVRYQ